MAVSRDVMVNVPDKEQVRAHARALGFDDCRFTGAHPPDHAPFFRRWLADGRHAGMQWLERQADRRCDPRRVLPGARTILLLAASYHLAEPDRVEAETPRGRVARYARHRDYHEVLREPLDALVGHLGDLGGPAVRSVALVDSGPLMERDLAHRAGLGFIGKHTNLIGQSLGNWFFLAGVLTTLEFEPDPPATNRCGHCARCLAACPTQALPAPFTLDARRCISYLTIEHKGSIPEDLRPAIGDRIFGCDDCLEACPWNRFAQTGRLLKAHAQAALARLDLRGLLRLDEAQFKTRFRDTPILRSKRAGLRRNVCVALGNVGGKADIPELERVLREGPPLAAEHAEWAIERIEGRTQA